MTIEDLLALDKNQTSIKKIDMFISSCDKFSEEYTKAICLKAIILHKIKKTNDALKLVYSLASSFNLLSNESIIDCCNTIIEICLDIARLDQVEKYMLIKKRHLPVSLKNSYLKDEINLALKRNNIKEAKNVLIEYLSDDLTKDEEIYAKYNLSEIYYNTKDYEKFLSLVHDLEDYYQTKLDFVKLTDLSLKKVNASYNMGDYLRVITEGSNSIRDSKLVDDNKVFIATRLILSYIGCLDYKKAAIIESDYEELLDNAQTKNALEFSKAALELYSKTNSLISIKDYQEKIKKYSTEKVEKIKKEKMQDYQIPVIQEQDIESSEYELSFKNEEAKVIIKEPSPSFKKIENIIVSENYEKLVNIFNIISKASLNNKFREIYRLALIDAAKQFNFKESYVLYYTNEYKGLHYKSERVYDKRLKYEDIDNTLSFLALDKEKDIFLDNESSYNINIVSGEAYQNDIYGLAFPLYDDTKAIGSIAFFSDSLFLDKEMTYESLKLIASMLNISLTNFLKQQKLEYENRRLYYLSENLPFITKEESNGIIHLIGKDNFLGIGDDLDEEVFFNHIKASDLGLYKKKLELLIESIDENVEIEYHFLVKDKYIKVKELMYPMYQDGIFIICSILENITSYENNINKLTELAYQNPLVNMATELKLMVDLDIVLPIKKSSLVILEVNKFSYYVDIYGYNFSNQLLFAIGNYLKEYFINDFNISLYYLSGNIYSILFKNVNDKRVIDSRLNEALEYVENKLFTLNSRVKLTFTCGVYRLNKNSTINSSSKLFSLALDALNDARNEDNNMNIISHFDSENHKNKFNERQLVTHISEAIDHGKIGISYQQIVNLTNKEVFGYMAKVNLDNYEIDYSYFKYVVKKRALEELLDKYLIANVIKEQKELLEKTKGKLLIFIELFKLTEVELLKFINTQITFFKYFENNIVFVCNECNTITNKLKEMGYFIASKSLVDLLNNRIDYLFYDINEVNDANELLALATSHKCTLIASNVNKKEEITKVIEAKIENCYGDFYKKGLRIKNIIEKVI